MTSATLELLKRNAHLFKRGGALLEIGEQNMYGDVGCQELWSSTDDPHAHQMIEWANAQRDLFMLAKAVYRMLFAPSLIEAIDLNGTPEAIRQDLNGPLQLERQYDVVYNGGTAEHIFNIAMTFKSMHDACNMGGYMIHEAPWQGWPDHGFYNLQPGLFYDLAYANEYELACLYVTHFQSNWSLRIESREQLHQLTDIPNNAMLFVLFRKTVDAPFRLPLQSVYAGRLSEEGQAAWRERR